MSRTFVVEATTRYRVDRADTPERVHAWFNDPTDIDLDVFTVNFADVRIVGVMHNDSALVELAGSVA